MGDMTAITLGNALLVAGLGYAVVFFGLVLLMVVIMIMGKCMTRTQVQTSAAAPAQAAAPETPKQTAPGTAGELKLWDTDPKDAAMIMAIVADSLGKPLNELRFISIREIKE